MDEFEFNNKFWLAFKILTYSSLEYENVLFPFTCNLRFLNAQ